MRSISTVGGFTLLSRIFGFIRDVLLARYLGAGMAADAFFIAFKLPNFFRRLFAEGAFSAGFVPLFSRALGKDITEESQAAALDFAGRVLSWLFPVLILLLLIMEAAMVPVMFGLTGGFDGDTAKFDFVVELGRYTFPYLVMISLVSFYAGMLNAYGRYSAAAFAPVLLNSSMIVALVLYGESDIDSARALAVSVSIAGILQLLLLYVAAKRIGVRLKLPRPRLSKDVRELFRIMGPAALGAGVMQINLFVDLIIAARFLPEGSISWLSFADRLNQLPLGVIGVAVGTVLLPSISRLLAAREDEAANAQQNRALEFSLFLTLPSAVALMVIADPIISTLFERGEFTATDTAATAAALVVYAAGLPAYVIAKALTPGYFARKDTVTPVRFAVISLVINTVLNIILIQFLEHVGLAAATAIAAWINVAMLYVGLKRRNHLTLLAATQKRIFKCTLSSLVMGATIWYATGFLENGFEADGGMRILTLTGLIVTGVIGYLIAASALRTLTLAEIKAFVRKSG